MRWRQIITTDSGRNQVLELSYINQIIEFGVKKKKSSLRPRESFFVNRILVNGIHQEDNTAFPSNQDWFEIN